ncbi:MAG: Holliday junction resolvase RuvX, partial [Actinomycetota bacterium]|nr:Holliday junction resolvase RuvX [Actinomycetota bacterium]
MKVLALDYGRAKTGVAISDATGTLARPLTVIERVDSDAGMARLEELLDAEDVERVVVGMPLTLGGKRGEQARATDRFVEILRSVTAVPVETFDERFTTDLAQRTSAATPEDARAAAHLLASYLTRTSST